MKRKAEKSTKAAKAAVNNAHPGTKKRKRRTKEEIIDRIIEAAGMEFGENGYSSGTTAAIARRAGVAEPLIFTHFGSKAKLYRTAVFNPLDRHFAAFLAKQDIESTKDGPTAKESRDYVSDLVTFVKSHSEMFKSLAFSEAYGKGEDGSAALQGLQDYFLKMSALEEKRLTRHPKVSPQLIARISFAAILACIMFDDWLFPVGVASGREIHEAICDFIMDGLNVNAPMLGPPPSRRK